MARKFNSNGIADGTLPGTKISSGTISASLVGSVRISSISITDNSYVVLDDTAVILTGGYIKIIGTGFVSGCSVAIDTTIATSVSFVSATQLNVQVPAKAAGTYNIYLTTPTGAVAIRVNAITYSSTPTWTSTSPLPGGVNNTAISIQLGATSDSTVSYTVQAGSTLPAGLTLSSGGLLAGTVTGLALETTYNFTVVATDVELQDSPKAFSITIIVSDPYFKNTVLLLQGDLTPFTADASTNKFELSAVGTPSANTNNPLQPGYYSGYFNGSTDYLSIAANSIYDFGSSNFTAECWIYPIAFNAIGGSFIGVGHQSGSASWYLGGDSTGAVGCAFWSSGTTVGGTMTSAAGVIAFNRWNHVAVTRNGNTWNIWSNGTSVATMINATAIGNEGRPFNIAYDYGSGAARLQNCYMSNVRIVKGVAVYTDAFTPPTAPLAATQSSGTNIAAITGAATSLLTGQSYRFIDNSTYQATLTLSGTPSISVTQPFTLPSPYTGYGSGLFNGSSYVSAPTNATKYQFLQSGTYTLEAWVYFTNPASATEGVITTGPVGTMKIYLSKGGGGITNGINSDASVGYTVTHYEWIHLAIVFSAGILKLYKNGVLANSTSYPWNISGTDFIVGRLYTDLSQYQLNGYVANARAVKDVAVYTGNFTPPTGPLTTTQSSSGNIAAITGTATSLLTLQTNQAQNNNQFRDSSTNNFAVTRTGTPTQGTFTPFSQTGWSGYFDGTTDCIQVPAGVAFAPGTGDFTVEGWFFPTNTMIPNYPTTLPGMLFNQAVSGTNYFTIEAGGGKIYFTATSSGGGTAIANGSNSWAVGSWNHFAVVRISGMVTVYLNGIGGTATSNTTDLSNTSYVPTIGRYTHAAQSYFFGYISNLRYVKGIGVYTGAFTPPTTALQATQSSGTNITAITGTVTSLLTLQNNRFKDNSTNNFAVTPSGIPSIQVFSPFAPTAAYSATTVGGSMYFDGTGDWITTPNVSAFNLSSSTTNFTIEAWVYNAVSGTYLGIIGARADQVGQGWCLYIHQNNTLYIGSVIVGNAYADRQMNTIVISANTWTHVALVKTASGYTAYVNGVGGSLLALTGGLDYQSGHPVIVGALGSQGELPFNGYVSDARIIKGTAVYTGAFTPPTAPLTAIANTVLLLNATNSGIFDATGKNDLVTVGDARVSTSKQKYGSGAMYFDGTGDWLSINAPTNLLNFGTGDFTIECWVYLNAVPSGYPPIITNENGFYINFRGSGTIALTDTSTAYATSPSALTAGSWFHVAIVSSSGSSRIYVNGTGGTAVACSVNWTATTITYIGGSPSYPAINGYIDDLRVTKYARYTTTFTPPSQAMLGM